MSECRCDKFIHPKKLIIPGGLSNIPRQIARFPEFQRAMLSAIRQHSSLYDWRARDESDFGIMLIEMWAYVADVQSFYDEVIAHEEYLRTARHRSSLQKLTYLLGYIPRPAVAATVSLAVLAEGYKSVVLPEGLAFRSSAFDSETPQVFELDAETTIHPLNNQWSLEAPQQKTLSSTGSASTESFSQMLMNKDTILKKDDLVLVRVGSTDDQTNVSTVTNVADTVGEDNKKYKQVDFDPPLSLAGNTNPADVEISSASQRGGLWTIAYVSGDPYSISDSQIILDGLYRSIKAGEYIVLGKEGNYRWFKVVENKEIMMTLSAATTTTVKDSEDNDVSVAVPAITAPATQLVLDKSVQYTSPIWQWGYPTYDWTYLDAPKITLYYGFITGGSVATVGKDAVAVSDGLVVSGPIEEPSDGTAPTKFLVEDKNKNGYEVGGALNYGTGEVTLNQGEGWTTPLSMPVTIYGNVVTASRGETVEKEVLGSGDASMAGQSFMLKKSPLTFTSSPTAGNEQGVISTLELYVNDILWKEVPSFFAAGPEDQVFIVRQNDEGKSTVIFGDGQHGARLPTGADNVIATYRYGAGKTAPPAGAITQLAKPVKGLTGVKSPVAAKGGDDAETADNIRTYAPQSALLLGRAVSIMDMEAVTAGVSGVRAVSSEWAWSQTKQRPVIQLWYIGDENIKSDISQKLHCLSDPATPIAVDVAIPISLIISIDVEIDDRHLEDVVLGNIRTALMDSRTGILSPERIGIGKPLFRSRVFEVVMAVEGAVSIRSILLKSQWLQLSWTTYAIKPPTGRYFDLEKGGLLLNGKES